MIDWSRIKNPVVRETVQRNATVFMARCHFGTQGIAKTKDDVAAAAKRLMDSGFHAIAFDTEMNYAEYAMDLLGDHSPVHVPVSYPMGRSTVSRKLHDLEKLQKMGVPDACVCLDWQAIFSGRYDDIEKEARLIMDHFGDAFVKNAFVIPATLMGDKAIIETCKALDFAGVISIKINPGCTLGVSPEEVQLISRNFPGRFDLHPSGNIRTLEAAEKYLELGCTVIHSASSLDIVDAYVKRELSKYGEAI